MSYERRQVLEMLSSGRISPEDAERLLDKLGESGERSQQPEEKSSAKPNKKLKYLRVVVSGGDSERVNIRVPISLARTGLGLATMVPREVGQMLHTQGIDLSHLKGLNPNELLEVLKDLHVDVDSEDGNNVRIFCE